MKPTAEISDEERFKKSSCYNRSSRALQIQLAKDLTLWLSRDDSSAQCLATWKVGIFLFVMFDTYSIISSVR
jgi:hypothetical protein